MDGEWLESAESKGVIICRDRVVVVAKRLPDTEMNDVWQTTPPELVRQILVDHLAPKECRAVRGVSRYYKSACRVAYESQCTLQVRFCTRYLRAHPSCSRVGFCAVNLLVYVGSCLAYVFWKRTFARTCVEPILWSAPGYSVSCLLNMGSGMCEFRVRERVLGRGTIIGARFDDKNFQRLSVLMKPEPTRPLGFKYVNRAP